MKFMKVQKLGIILNDFMLLTPKRHKYCKEDSGWVIK